MDYENQILLPEAIVRAFQLATHEYRSIFLNPKGNKACVESDQSLPLSSFRGKRKYSRSVILKLKCALESLGRLVKTQVAECHP